MTAPVPEERVRELIALLEGEAHDYDRACADSAAGLRELLAARASVAALEAERDEAIRASGMAEALTVSAGIDRTELRWRVAALEREAAAARRVVEEGRSLSRYGDRMAAALAAFDLTQPPAAGAGQAASGIVADLAMVVRCLLAYPNSEGQRTRALDFLRSHGLQGSPLRGQAASGGDEGRAEG